jgi:hypothetical protein
MGNFLDLLLARVQDDGVELDAQEWINFVGFTIAEDAANKRITVTAASSTFVEMAGDVTGDSDDNRISTISGPRGEDDTVAVATSKLLWDTDVSSGAAEISISGGELDAGAIQVRHSAKRVLLFTGSGVVIGNSTAKNVIDGGVALTTRTISGNVTLDTTTTDAIGWIVASGEKQVTLPPPSAGRIHFFPTVGGTSPSIRRGSALINGAASHYAMPLDAAGGIGVAISDGTNWVVRSIYTPTGGATESAIVFSPVDTLRENNTDNPADTGGNQTSGTAFYVRSGATCSITGIRFYWAGTANQVIKTVLYSAAGAVLKTANVTTAGAGVYTSVFASAQTADPGIQYKATVYDTSGASQKYTKVSNSSTTALLVPARPFFGGRRIAWINLGLWLAGDNNPTSTAGGEWYLVEPVLSE